MSYASPSDTWRLLSHLILLSFMIIVLEMIIVNINCKLFYIGYFVMNMSVNLIFAIYSPRIPIKSNCTPPIKNMYPIKL